MAFELVTEINNEYILLFIEYRAPQQKSLISVISIRPLHYINFINRAFWCHKKAFKDSKRFNLMLTVSSSGLVALGTIVGVVTLNPAVLVSVSGCGMIIGAYQKLANCSGKIEMSKFAYKTYEKYVQISALIYEEISTIMMNLLIK